MKWEKIETAPRYLHVLVAVELHGPGDWRISTGYIDSQGEWFVFGWSFAPSYWMPLPTPPGE